MAASKDVYCLFGLFGRSRRGYRTIQGIQTRCLVIQEGRNGKEVCDPFRAHHRLYSAVAVAVASRPLSPAVRYLVDTHKLNDLSVITATGPAHRLLKGDILQHIESLKEGKVTPPVKEHVRPSPKQKSSKQSPPPSSFTDLPLDRDRVATAERLTQYKITAPYTYGSINCSVARIMELSRDKETVDMTSFFVKAAALTLQRLPQSNCVWNGNDVESLSTISVSVTSQGVSVMVGDADRSSLEAISKVLKEGNNSSRFSGNTSISISHLDAVNITQFTSVISPSQSSTLSIGSIQALPNEQGAPSLSVTATLTADARVMDYELSCNWLDTFRRIVESPETNGLL